MIGYLQIQNFILNNKNEKIYSIIHKDFKSYCRKNKLKVLDIFSDKFHNGSFDEIKAISILYFNEYINQDKRIEKIFVEINNCTEQFFIQFKQNDIIKLYIKYNIYDIINYVEERNIYLADKMKDLIHIDLTSKSWLPYLSFIEEYILINNKQLYFDKIINIKKIYFDFIDFIEKKYINNKTLELDEYYMKNLKTNDIIINKYMKSLLQDKALDDLFDVFNEEDNSLMIFISMKNKYFLEFINKNEKTFDLNLYNIYSKSELFNNNNIIYLFNRS